MVAVSILSGEMVSGQRLAQVPASSGNVRAILNAAGEITCTVPLRDRDIRPRAQELIAMMEPWRTFLAFQAGEQIVEAGPVVSQNYDNESGELAVKAVGLRGLLAHRLVIDGTSATPQKETLSYSGLSLGTIGKRLVQRTLANPGGILPILLPDDEAGSEVWEYAGHQFFTVESRLSDLSGVDGGPQFAFEPRFTEDLLGIEWLMRAGTTSEPLLSQTGDDWIWDTSIAGAVAGMSVERDGSSRINSVRVTGQGQDVATLLASDDDPAEWDRDYPLLERAYSQTDIGRQATLNKWPPAYLQQGSRPWTSWKLDVLRDTYPTLAEYRPGDWVSVRVADHPYLPDGTYRSRIGSISASLAASTVSIDLEPTLEWR